MKTTTPSGNQYILSFVDDFSKFTVIYLLQDRSEVAENLKDVKVPGQPKGTLQGIAMKILAQNLLPKLSQ
jgi:hypothetical protein